MLVTLFGLFFLSCGTCKLKIFSNFKPCCIDLTWEKVVVYIFLTVSVCNALDQNQIRSVLSTGLPKLVVSRLFSWARTVYFSIPNYLVKQIRIDFSSILSNSPVPSAFSSKHERSTKIFYENAMVADEEGWEALIWCTLNCSYKKISDYPKWATKFLIP